MALFGLYVFRDINDTATSWSRIYKESRGIRPESFTFADVPTIRGMGFMFMVGGFFFVAAGFGMAFHSPFDASPSFCFETVFERRF